MNESKQSIDYMESCCLNADIGVPQDSIIGSILYVSNISSVVKDIPCIAYADDFSMVFIDKWFWCIIEPQSLWAKSHSTLIIFPIFTPRNPTVPIFGHAIKIF